MKIITSLITAILLSTGQMMAQSTFTPTTAADSAGYYIGFTQGALIGRSINGNQQITDKDAYRNDFIRGVTLALLADTVNTGLADGIRAGEAMRNELIKLYAIGLPCNMQLFNETFTAQVLNPDTALITPYMQVVSSLITPVETRAKQQHEQAQAAARQQYLDLAAANIAAGKAFMDSIKANVKDIQVTPSGLAYQIIRKGNGDNIQPKQQGLINYVGRLVDGTVFDSSEPGKPIRLGPMNVIPGFSEALQLMNKGSKFIFYIPQDLAYGMQAPPALGPGQTLIFEIEVLDIDDLPQP